MSADVKVLHNIDEDRSSLCQLLQDCQHLEAETWSDEKICGATEIYELVLATGSDRITATHKMVELYPCPRVKERVDRVTYKGIQAGTTCDLRPNKFGESYDLTKHSDGAKVRSIIRIEKPYLVIGCPPCTEYTQL